MAQNGTSVNRKVYDFAKNKVGQKVGNGACAALVEAALEHAGANTASYYDGDVPKTKEYTDTYEYTWGKEINLLDVQPGDILQFRNHEMIISDQTRGTLELPDGNTVSLEMPPRERHPDRGHHSAIVSANKMNGVLVIFEQHVRTAGKKRETVQENQIYVANQAAQDDSSFEKKTRVFNLGNTAHLHELEKLFGRDQVESIKKKYRTGKLKFREERRTFEVKVSGIIYAYRPEPKEP